MVHIHLDYLQQYNYASEEETSKHAPPTVLLHRPSADPVYILFPLVAICSPCPTPIYNSAKLNPSPFHYVKVV